MSKRTDIRYSETERAFLQANCTLTRQKLTDAFNARFGRSLSKANIAGMCKRNGWLTGRSGRFVKGSQPANKGRKGLHSGSSTSFRKGSRPHNTVPVGTEVLVAGVWVKVKVAEPNVWRSKARMVWEQHHGRIPHNSVLLHIDSNPENNDIGNLVLISRSDLGRLNARGYHQQPLAVRPALITVSKIETKIRKLGQS